MITQQDLNDADYHYKESCKQWLLNRNYIMKNSQTTNYMHNKLSEIFGTDNYAEVMKTRSHINPLLKAAIDKAFKEAKNKSTFKRLTKQYARLTAHGIKECTYCQKLLNKF